MVSLQNQCSITLSHSIKVQLNLSLPKERSMAISIQVDLVIFFVLLLHISSKYL